MIGRRLVCLVLAAGFGVAAAPGGAAATPSCVGQILSTIAPQSAGAVGAIVSFEARNPETIGAGNLGEFASGLARAPRDACPELV